MFYRPNNRALSRLPNKEKDCGVTLFYIDPIKNANLPFFVTPIPLRIDKISNVSPISFVNSPQLFEQFANQFNFKQFYLLGLKNLIFYTQNKYYELFKKKLNFDVYITWWMRSKGLNPQIPSFVEDQSFLIKTFLEFKDNLTEQSYQNKVSQYFDDIITYTKKRLQENRISFLCQGKTKEKPIYIKRRKKIFPMELECDIIDITHARYSQKKFMPYHTYLDLLECAIQNKEMIESNDSLGVFEPQEFNLLLINNDQTENFLELSSVDVDEDFFINLFS